MFDQDWLDGYLDDIVHKFSEESKYAVWHSSGGSSQLLAYQMGAPGTGVNLSMPHRTAVAGSDQHILERYYNVVDTGNDMKKATMYNTEHDVERIMDMFLAAKPHPTGLVIFRGVGGGLAKSILDSRKYRQGCTSMMVFHDTFISFSTQARVAARYARLEGVVFVIRAPACGVSILPFLGLAEGGAQRQYEGLLPPQTIFEVHTETLRAPPPSDRGLPHTVECTAYTPLCDGYRAAYDRYIGQRLVYSNEHGLAVCMPYPGQVVGGSLFDGMIKELGDLLGFEDLALDE
ncbi:hypothetical protein DAPPUDRAFT_279669 [Daphnia pulex]|uniref:Uncharacterized protein n=1 Tax=Daphnia pulex TaxID=6669 RepID=E9I7J0_DAPPU|nr:hypothetical protein DAPPUDRAFT_279669 [Daphnia pulex]|eukprot:EFX60040.1 hypothetical protein DAPPUDRAFT_279669 [Daphnia pulex]